MPGPGTHLHRMVKRWLGVDYWPGCGCKDLAEEMDKEGPAWCREKPNFRRIAAKMHAAAKQIPDWRKRILSKLPGVRLPIKAMVRLAIRWAEEDEAEKLRKLKDET